MRRVKHFHSTIFHCFWELYSFLQNDLIMCSLGLGESNLEEYVPVDDQDGRQKSTVTEEASELFVCTDSHVTVEL